jgi:hypothetical protein
MYMDIGRIRLLNYERNGRKKCFNWACANVFDVQCEGGFFHYL